MSTNTSYGTWNNHGDRLTSNVETTVEDSLNGGSGEWVERMRTSGAIAKIISDYRDAIEAALPPSVSLCGDQFIGPAYEADCDWDGDLDISGCIKAIDLYAIVERHDIDN